MYHIAWVQHRRMLPSLIKPIDALKKRFLLRAGGGVAAADGVGGRGVGVG